MPSVLPQAAIDDAEAAVQFAIQVRKYHRRRTDKKASKQRHADIESALARLKAAMAPLRSEIGRFTYGPQTDAAEGNREAIRQASAAIQSQRRQLWKMRPR